jgi:hypothetical protein
LEALAPQGLAGGAQGLLDRLSHHREPVTAPVELIIEDHHRDTEDAKRFGLAHEAPFTCATLALRKADKVSA